MELYYLIPLFIYFFKNMGKIEKYGVVEKGIVMLNLIYFRNITSAIIVVLKKCIRPLAIPII